MKFRWSGQKLLFTIAFTLLLGTKANFVGDYFKFHSQLADIYGKTLAVNVTSSGFTRSARIFGTNGVMGSRGPAPATVTS